MKMGAQILDSRQTDQFMQLGWCLVEDCFSPEAARKSAILDRRTRVRSCRSPGLGDGDPPQLLKRKFRGQGIAPKAWAAAEDLVGKDSFTDWTWGRFIVNIRLGRENPGKCPRRIPVVGTLTGTFFIISWTAPNKVC